MAQGKLNYSFFQKAALFLMRTLIGWHFLFEGLSKLANENWSAAGYLLSSKGPFASLFLWLGSYDSLLPMINQINIWGLIVIGIFLMVGVFVKISSVGAIAFLVLYYLCIPPFPGLDHSVSFEGNYLLVDKNLIEISGLLIIYLFPLNDLGIMAFARRRDRSDRNINDV